jgi:hypothetical protein
LLWLDSGPSREGGLSSTDDGAGKGKRPPFPVDGLVELARIDVVAAAGLEASARVAVAVWRVLPAR